MQKSSALVLFETWDGLKNAEKELRAAGYSTRIYVDQTADNAAWLDVSRPTPRAEDDIFNELDAIAKRHRGSVEECMKAIEKAVPQADSDVDANAEEMSRFAINPDWSSDQGDPRNARYLRPLLPEDEDFASLLADTSFGAWIDEHDRNGRAFDPDKLFKQCLVDARRILCDREYAALFAPEEWFEPQTVH